MTTPNRTPLVSRWHGDIMTIIANVRIIPQAIDEAYQQLKDALTQLQQNP